MGVYPRGSAERMTPCQGRSAASEYLPNDPVACKTFSLCLILQISLQLSLVDF